LHPGIPVIQYHVEARFFSAGYFIYAELIVLIEIKSVPMTPIRHLSNEIVSNNVTLGAMKINPSKPYASNQDVFDTSL